MHTHQHSSSTVVAHRCVPAAVSCQAVVDVPLSGVDVRLGISIRQNAVSGVEVLGGAVATCSPRDRMAAEVVRQLAAYFQDPRQAFSLPLLLEGTPYQRRVWAALRAIPAGRTLTYGELAQQVGGGARAVGNACRRNPIPIIVPCHRAVSITGLGGYMGETVGAGLVLKARLLSHEASAKMQSQRGPRTE